MPGLLKSPAFGVGAFQAINVRYDRMAENAEKYKLAAQKRGAELFKEYKVTKATKKLENEAKINIATDFGPAMADFLDMRGDIKMIAGQNPKEFYDLVKRRAGEVESAGGIPSDFTANDNMYYGTQRFEDVTTSYNKIQNFMDTQNNVFGSSFGLLMEENTPEKMTEKQFGVTAREDISSLGRTGISQEPIKGEQETRLIKMVDNLGHWSSELVSYNQFGERIITIGDPVEAAGSSVARTFANIHYRVSPDRSEDGLGFSATTGINIAKGVMGYADSADDKKTAIVDMANALQFMQNNIPTLAPTVSNFSYQQAVIGTVNLYLMAYEKSTRASKQDLIDLRELAERSFGVKIPPTIGVPLDIKGGVQSGGYDKKNKVDFHRAN
jgi:hypothetical protein